MTHPRSTSSALMGLILIVVSACSSDTTGSNGKAVSLSFSTKSKAAPSVVGANHLGLLTQTVGTNTLVISTAQVVMAKIELTSNLATNCMDNSGSADCEELKADPSLVNLPTDPSVTTAVVKSVPAGTYDAFEGKVKVVQSTDQGGASFLMTNPTFTGVSVHVGGTYNGMAFACNSVATAELELEFPKPIVVDATGLNITVNVDLAKWFVDGSGALVDPTNMICGGSSAALVDQNIHGSFEAFEDDNKNGVDDSTEH